MASGDDQTRLYYDAAIAGRPVVADGGSIVEGMHEGLTVTAAARETFAGTLTGRCMDIGDPPWRWLEIGDLTEKPDNVAASVIWCEQSFVYFTGEHAPHAGRE